MSEVKDSNEGAVVTEPVARAFGRPVGSGDRLFDLRDEEKKRRVDQLFESAVSLAQQQLALLEAVVASAGRRRLKSKA